MSKLWINFRIILSDVSSAFSGCESLQTLNLSGFVFEKGFKAKGFLEDCGALQDLNLSNSRIYESDDYDEMFINVTLANLTIYLEGAKILTALDEYLKKNNVNIIGNYDLVDKPDNINKKSSGGLSGGAIAGLVVACVVVVVVVVAVTVVSVTTTAVTGGAAVAATSVASGAAASKGGLATGGATTGSLVWRKFI